MKTTIAIAALLLAGCANQGAYCEAGLPACPNGTAARCAFDREVAIIGPSGPERQWQETVSDANCDANGDVYCEDAASEVRCDPPVYPQVWR